FGATDPVLVGHPPAIVQSSTMFQAEIIYAPVRPNGTFGKEATAPVIAPALALQI
ncbi:16091_t:CDS:1, partial [Funneliformis geosporum]